MATGRNFPFPAPSRRFPKPSPHRLCPSIYTLPVADSIKTILVEIQLGSRTIYLSQEGVSATGRFYEPRILSMSPITREISYITGMYRTGDVTIELASPQREWETIIANESILHRRIHINYATTNSSKNTTGEARYGCKDIS